jgi:hypothetical protein
MEITVVRMVLFVHSPLGRMRSATPLRVSDRPLSDLESETCPAFRTARSYFQLTMSRIAARRL